MEIVGSKDAVFTRLEDGRNSQGRADALREKDLVVLAAERSHHQAEDVEKSPDPDEVSRAVVVIGHSDDRTHAHHDEDLQRRDPRDGAGRVVAQKVILVVFLESADT